ncbi:DUF4020 domain-containing protein [Streptosporangiaceae bacterium NEAU-GS5]|nr:DUF4020 domain-containing protein [Streptosporangiaceae bacterium NEAU-GS5]
MWIREVDFPAALVEAHRAGKLVLFVGAGASRDAPSSLPLFTTLTARIADEAQIPATADDLNNPDVFLGKLLDQQVDVHRLVATHIGAPASEPNRLHKALGELAVAGGPVRIVTTNYDGHLSAVLRERNVGFEEYIGPALPMGDDFTGIVYLHGSLRREPRQLIVTDGDFGRAYLRDAWAARFLERMFATYTVLFIGYSHADVVMRYLARALGPGARRYALTSDDTGWHGLGIVTIGYPVVGGSHTALVDAAEGWASLASMGLLDHRQRILRLVSVPPSQLPEEASYLEAVVADPDRVRLFAELARGEEWLSWAATQPEVRRLFDPMASPTECTPTLASWFAEHFAMDEALTFSALDVVRSAGGSVGPTLWSELGRHMAMRDSPRPDWLGPWLVLLIQNATDATSYWLEYALTASRWPDDRSAAVLLFDHMTEPHAQPRPAFGMTGGPRFEIRLKGDHHWLDEAWRQLFSPNLAEAAPAVLAVADRHLRRAFQLLDTAGHVRHGWDPVSFGRSAIEPHPQDGHPESIDVLIDAARDCLETLLDIGDARGASYLASWADSEAPLLRRLALHGVAHRADVDGASKIAWLRDRAWLFDPRLRHEVFRLIETALPSAGVDAADALVADVLAGSDDAADADLRAYEQFNALTWIKRHAADLRSAQLALEQIRARHPDFEERQNPDLVMQVNVGRIRRQPPTTAEALHESILANAADAIGELRRYEAVRPPSTGPTWDDALGLLVETVGGHPRDGLSVLDAAGGDHPDIVGSVISGWSTADVEGETAEAILARLTRLDLSSVAGSLSSLLADGGRGDANPTKWFLFPAARQLAADLWAVLDSAPAPTDVSDWLSRAISHPAGKLAQFWMQAVAADWREAGESWAGLPAYTQVQLDVLLTGDDVRSTLAGVVFAGQVRFFFGADRPWCEARVLPLLDWAADSVRARRAWGGYLAWGQPNDQLLAAGLGDYYLATATHLGAFREEQRRQFCSHLAAVALFSDMDPRWIRSFTRTVEAVHRVEWMNQVAWTLDDMPADAVEHQWQRWMRPYWRDRVDSIPLHLTFEEASAMAAWVVHLTEPRSIGEAVRLAKSMGGRPARTQPDTPRTQ